MDSVVVKRKKRNSNSVCAILDSTGGKPYPLGNVLQGQSVAIVASTEEKDGELDGDRELRAV
jgi:hypothetical protein